MGDTWSQKGRNTGYSGFIRASEGRPIVRRRGKTAIAGCARSRLWRQFLNGTVGCQPIGTASDRTTFLVGAANIDNVTVDVGTALISAGAAFAATLPSGKPVSAAYAVAELQSTAGVGCGKDPSNTRPRCFQAGNDQRSVRSTSRFSDINRGQEREINLGDQPSRL